jgi:hypothetical protein
VHTPLGGRVNIRNTQFVNGVKILG